MLLFYASLSLVIILVVLEGPVGLEPTTLCLRGRCSNQLSYGPVVPAEGFEPPTFASEARRSNPLSYAGIITGVIISVLS